MNSESLFHLGYPNATHESDFRHKSRAEIGGVWVRRTVRWYLSQPSPTDFELSRNFAMDDKSYAAAPCSKHLEHIEQTYLAFQSFSVRFSIFKHLRKNKSSWDDSKYVCTLLVSIIFSFLLTISNFRPWVSLQYSQMWVWYMPGRPWHISFLSFFRTFMVVHCTFFSFPLLTHEIRGSGTLLVHSFDCFCLRVYTHF